jgi:hypothetical protein
LKKKLNLRTVRIAVKSRPFNFLHVNLFQGFSPRHQTETEARHAFCSAVCARVRWMDGRGPEEGRVRARAVSACVPGRFLRARPGSFCVRARAVPACVPGRFLRACFFHLLCVVGQMGYPAWLLLSGTEHAITETEDVDVVKAVYNKYKKCKKQDAFRASIDALFYVNTYKARNPSTYFADMKRIKEQFDKTAKKTVTSTAAPAAPSAIPEYAPEISSTTFAHVMPSKIGFKGEPQAGGIVRPPSKRAHDPKGFVGSHAQKNYLNKTWPLSGGKRRKFAKKRKLA